MTADSSFAAKLAIANVAHDERVFQEQCAELREGDIPFQATCSRAVLKQSEWIALRNALAALGANDEASAADEVTVTNASDARFGRFVFVDASGATDTCMHISWATRAIRANG